MSFRYKRDWQAMGILGLAFIPIYILASCTQAQAQTVDGNFLHSQCQLDMGFESAYVTGVVDALIISGAAMFSLPPNGIVRQNRDVVCNGLAANPEYRELDASVLVHAFLSKAFPK